MDLSRLRAAERLGGALLHAPGAPPLVVAERSARHGAAQVLVLAAEPDALEEPLAAVAALQAEGLDLNLVAVLDPGADRAEALRAHSRRLGALLCALEARPVDPGEPPILVRRLPGRLRAPHRPALARARLPPLERSGLAERHPGWDADRIDAVYVAPSWESSSAGWTVRWWSGVEPPDGAEILAAPLELPTASPLADAIRAALRAATGRPVRCLPADGDPGPLHALAQLTADLQLVPAGLGVWPHLLRALAALPAPPHFCARC